MSKPNKVDGKYKSLAMRANGKHIPFKIREKDFVDMGKMPCAYCGEVRGEMSVELVCVRGEGAVGYTRQNTEAVCRLCLSLKNSLAVVGRNGGMVHRDGIGRNVLLRLVERIYDHCFEQPEVLPVVAEKKIKVRKVKAEDDLSDDELPEDEELDDENDLEELGDGPEEEDDYSVDESEAPPALPVGKYWTRAGEMRDIALDVKKGFLRDASYAEKSTREYLKDWGK